MNYVIVVSITSELYCNQVLKLEGWVKIEIVQYTIRLKASRFPMVKKKNAVEIVHQ